MSLAELELPKSTNWIPAISHRELLAREKKIRPVVRFRKILCYIKPTDPVSRSFIMNPQAHKMAPPLQIVTDITTFHEPGHHPHGFFKPSVAEVLAAIPDNLVNQIVAFEMLGPIQTKDEFIQHKAAFDDGMHVATTRLYRQA